MHPFRSQGIHDSSHFVYRDAAHGCRISFQQDIEQAYCRVKFEVFSFLRQSETMENHFRFGGQGIIGLVAQFQLGYKGYIQLAIRSGYYERLNVVEIKEGELMSYNPLDEEIKVSLITDEEERENTPTIGYYAMFRYHNGFIKSIYWSRNKMEAFALKYSKGYRKKSGYTFWEKDFDAMARKTMLRQLISKWGIMSIEMQKALDSDMAVVNEDGTVDYIDSDYEEDNSSPSNVETPSENDTTVVESNADIENDPLA